MATCRKCCRTGIRKRPDGKKYCKRCGPLKDYDENYVDEQFRDDGQFGVGA